jgi:hypothetical protein
MNNRPVIPSIDKVRAAISQFNAQDWTHLNPTQVNDYVKMLDDYFYKNIGFVFRSLYFTISDKLPKKVYRVRKYDHSINAGLISEFSHPPANVTCSIQRASLPHHPAFYCAPGAHTALLETLKYTFKNGEENLYFISEWSFRKDQPINVTSFLFGEYDKVDMYNTFKEKTFENFKSKIPDITPEETESLREIFTFIATLFEYEDTHAISGYLGHIHLYASSNIRTDVFIYPSIATGKASLNFAIHPNAVLHKLMLQRVFLVGVPHYHIDKNNGTAKINFIIKDRLGINNDYGYMMWRNLPVEDRVDFEKMFPVSS